MMRRATFTGPGQPLEVIDDVMPVASPRGALVRTTYAGVCHFDVQLRRDEIDLGDNNMLRFGDILGEKAKGRTFGHEICGVVMTVGEEADPYCGINEGDRVVVFPWIGCGRCGVCDIGMNNMCEDDNFSTTEIGMNPDINGGYATHVPVPDCRYLVKISENLPMDVACMLPCSAATSYSSLCQVTSQIDYATRVRGQANLLVVGAGGLGLWCIQLAKKALFAEKNVKIYIANRGKDKIPAAIEAGADEGIVWEEGASIEENINKTTNGGDRKMDAIIDMVGNPTTSAIAMGSVSKSGIVLVIGTYGGCMKIQTPVLVLNGITVKGSKTSSLNELRELVKVADEEGYTYSNLQYYKLDDVNQALDDLEAGRIKSRAVIKFD